jgi:hypothetical protein
MTSTTKYVLIGGAALVGVVFIARRMASQAAAASKPTGVAGVVSGLSSAYDSIKTVSWRSALPTSSPTSTLSSGALSDAGGGKYYGPGATDGTASGADAMGLRSLRPQITADQLFYDARFAGLKAA